MIDYEIIIKVLVYVIIGIYMTSDLDLRENNTNSHSDIGGCGYAIALLLFFPIILIRMIFTKRKN